MELADSVSLEEFDLGGRLLAFLTFDLTGGPAGADTAEAMAQHTH